MYLGQNIKYLRKIKHLSRDELAERFDFTQATIGKWERGDSKPSPEQIVLLSDIFNVSTDDLLKVDLSARPQVQAKITSNETNPELVALRAEVVAMHEKLAQTHSQDPALLEMAAAFMRQLKAKYPEVAKEMGLIE